MFRSAGRIFLFTLLWAFSFAAYADTTLDKLFRNPGDPTAGNPKGNITIVEFFDYQCGHCASMAPVIDAIIKANPNVRFIFKELPIRGPISEFAAQAALAANKQGKYFQFNHALFASDQFLTEAAILDIAKKQGMNVEKLKKDMTSNAVQAQLKANLEFAGQLGIPGTPAIFIGKTDATSISNVEYIPGEVSQRDFQKAIDNAEKT